MDTIIFDVDDTLYDQAQPFKEAFQKIIDASLTEEELHHLYIASRKYSDALFDKNVSGEVSLEEMHIYRITEACRDHGITIEREKAKAFQEAYLAGQQQITMFKEMEELISRLHKQNKQLAVLTNGEENHQSMKVTQLKLDRWIPEEQIFISGKVGHAKPAREVFQFLEEKLQLDKNKTIYIGDSFENDIIGAKQVGWQAVWMNHRNREMPETTIKPDYVVKGPKELLDIF